MVGTARRRRWESADGARCAAAARVELAHPGPGRGAGEGAAHPVHHRLQLVQVDPGTQTYSTGCGPESGSCRSSSHRRTIPGTAAGARTPPPSAAPREPQRRPVRLAVLVPEVAAAPTVPAAPRTAASTAAVTHRPSRPGRRRPQRSGRPRARRRDRQPRRRACASVTSRACSAASTHTTAASAGPGGGDLGDSPGRCHQAQRISRSTCPAGRLPTCRCTPPATLPADTVHGHVHGGWIRPTAAARGARRRTGATRPAWRAVPQQPVQPAQVHHLGVDHDQHPAMRIPPALDRPPGACTNCSISAASYPHACASVRVNTPPLMVAITAS